MLAALLSLLYLIEPFWRFRLGELREDRIGHLAQDTELFARTLAKEGRPPRTTYIFFAWNPANRQLLKMWKRAFRIVESRWLRRAYIGARPLLVRTRFHQALPNWHNSPSFDLLGAGRPSLRFTPEEEALGRRLLAEMGIGPDDWFVTIHTHDPAYMGTRTGFGATVLVKRHHQDGSIEAYYDAARWIRDKGGFVVRMGAVVQHPLPDLGPRLIDYATKYRSDFMDVYLCAKSRLFLGGNAGLMQVPQIFNVPVACANMFPYMILVAGVSPLHVPKLLRSTSDSSICSLPELARMGLLQAPLARWGQLTDLRTYESRGLELVDNDSQDVLDLAMDAFDLLEGRPPPAEGARLQAIYRSYYTGNEASPYASGVSPRFLMRYPELVGQNAVRESARQAIAVGERRS